LGNTFEAQGRIEGCCTGLRKETSRQQWRWPVSLEMGRGKWLEGLVMEQMDLGGVGQLVCAAREQNQGSEEDFIGQPKACRGKLPW